MATLESHMQDGNLANNNSLVDILIYLATEMIPNNNIKWMHKLKDGLITLAGELEVVLTKYGFARDDV